MRKLIFFSLVILPIALIAIFSSVPARAEKTANPKLLAQRITLGPSPDLTIQSVTRDASLSNVIVRYCNSGQGLATTTMTVTVTNNSDRTKAVSIANQPVPGPSGCVNVVIPCSSLTTNCSAYMSLRVVVDALNQIYEVTDASETNNEIAAAVLPALPGPITLVSANCAQDASYNMSVNLAWGSGSDTNTTSVSIDDPSTSTNPDKLQTGITTTSYPYRYSYANNAFAGKTLNVKIWGVNGAGNGPVLSLAPITCPTLAPHTINVTAVPVCANGNTPNYYKFRIISTKWPPGDAAYSYTAYADRQATGSFTFDPVSSTTTNQGIYIGLQTQQYTQPLNLTGTSPRSDITYAQYWTERYWMARFANTVPSGNYTIKFEAPADSCAPTPTITVKGVPYCSNGVMPTGKYRFFYYIWPPVGYMSDFGYTTAATGIQTKAFALPGGASTQSVYVGMQEDRGDILDLQPVGTPPRSDITYAKYWTTQQWMARIPNTAPTGTYTINYQVPAAECVASAFKKTGPVSGALLSAGNQNFSWTKNTNTAYTKYVLTFKNASGQVVLTKTINDINATFASVDLGQTGNNPGSGEVVSVKPPFPGGSYTWQVSAANSTTVQEPADNGTPWNFSMNVLSLTNCDVHTPNWRISNVDTSIVNGKVMLVINGTFPHSEDCMRRTGIGGAAASTVSTYKNPYPTELKGYVSTQNQVDGISDSKIALPAIFAYSDGTWYAQVFFCTGATTKGQCVNGTNTYGTITSPAFTINNGGSTNCVCKSDNTCDTSCSFDKYTTSQLSNVSYANPIGCSLASVPFSSTPTQANKNAWCQRAKRTMGDADGDTKINDIDYFYYVQAVSGGKLPSDGSDQLKNINPDANGNGSVGTEDRIIMIKSLGGN